MGKRTPLGPLASTAAWVALLLLLVVALRGALPGTGPRQHAPGPSAGPVVVFIVAVAVAAVALVASLRYRRAPRRPRISTVAPPRSPLTWRPFAYLALAVALAAGVALLLTPRHPATPVPPAPNAPPTTTDAAPTAPPDGGAPAAVSHLWPSMLVALPVLLALFAVGALLYRRGRGTATGEKTPATRSAPDALVHAAALALAAVTELDRDPRAAIIDCYLAMERGLAEAPGAAPRASDTASEVLARAVEQDVLHDDSAAQLVGLFTEARFSRHEMTERQREFAATMLRQVLDDLRGVPCVPRR